jgi:carbon storage regulator
MFNKETATWKEPHMLVLTRKLNEQIVIGNQRITVKIVDVRGSRVRLGIDAPDDVRIERGKFPGPKDHVDSSPEAVCP